MVGFNVLMLKPTIVGFIIKWKIKANSEYNIKHPEYYSVNFVQ